MRARTLEPKADAFIDSCCIVAALLALLVAALIAERVSSALVQILLVDAGDFAEAPAAK